MKHEKGGMVAYAGVLPVLAEMQLSQRSARLVAPGSHYDSRGIHALPLSVPIYHDAYNSPVFAYKLPHGRLEPSLDTGALESRTMRSDEALAAVARAESHAAPELKTAVDLVCLPIKRKKELHADGPPQPLDGSPGSVDDRAHEPRVAPSLADAHDVVREIIGAVRIDVDARHELRRDVLDDGEEVCEARVHRSVRPRCEVAVPARPGFGAFVEDEYMRAAVFCG